MAKRRKRKKRKLNQNGTIGVLVLLGVVVALLIQAVVTKETYVYDPTTDVPYVEDTRIYGKYDMTLLQNDNGLYHYEDDQYTSVIGVDVSVHNKEIDWAALSKAGVRFAMIRVGFRGYTEGYIQEDEYFERNVQAALDNGIQVGVYFFSQAINEDEAAEEAKYVIEKIHSYPITWPVAYDYELYPQETGARGNAITMDQRTRCANVFLENIRNAGYTPMIYASTDTYDQLFYPDYLSEYAFWVAQYNTVCTYRYEYSMWQYSDQGGVQGIPQGMDLDIAFLPK